MAFVLRLKITRYYLLIVSIVLALAGCSSNSGSIGPGYQSARAQGSLELPPDLINSTNSGITNSTAQATEDIVLPAIEGITIEGAGLQRFLKVAATPGNTWTKMLDFVSRNNLPILTESKREGTLETDWVGDASNDSETKTRMRTLLGSLAGRSPINNKYKFWLERLDENNTAVHVEHTKLTEISIFPKNDRESFKSGWEESTGNEFQVVEMLRKMQTFFGGKSVAPEANLVQLITDGEEKLILAQPFDQAWATVASAIKGTKYELLDINNEKRIYVIKPPKQKSGLLSKISFRRKLGVKLASLNETSSLVTITSKRGGFIDREEALPVLYAIAGELRK